MLKPADERAEPVLDPAVGGERDRGGPGALRVVERAHSPDERVAVLAGHLDVGDEDVRPPRPGAPEALGGRRARPHLGPAVDQHRREQLEPVALVVDHQDPQPAERRVRGAPRSGRAACARRAGGRGLRRVGAREASGSVTVNVAPWPSPSLSASRCRRAAPRGGDDRQAEAEAAVARGCDVLSACRKRSKTWGRKSGRDALPGVADHDLDVRVHALQVRPGPARPSA